MKKILSAGIILLALIIAGCGGDEPSEQKIEGRLTDENGAPIAGAVVQIFSAQSPDTLAARLFSQYGVGAPVSATTDFDHRFSGLPVAQTTTGSDGSFSLSGSGRFHVAITHPDYSWRYVYNVTGKVGDIKTKPGIKVSGALGSNVEWMNSGQDYIVTATAVVPANSQFTVGAGVRVRLESQAAVIINQGSTIRFTGTLDQPVVFTSNSDSSEKNFHSGVQFTSCNIQAEYTKFSAGAPSVRFSKCSGEIKNCYFENSVNGASISQSNENFSFQNILTRNCENTGLKTETETILLSSIVCHGNLQRGLEISQLSTQTIRNCYLSSDKDGLFISGNSVVKIENSECTGKSSGAYLQASKGNFSFCSLKGNIALTIQDNQSGGGGFHQADCSETNFYATDNTIVFMRAPSENIFAHCYFDGTATTAEIKLRLPVQYGNGNKPSSAIITNPAFTPIASAGLKK